MDKHEVFMQRCLDLAIKAIGHVAPNPMVGSVIVHDGRIIGEGYHQKFGQAHAEVNAVNSVQAKEILTQSTLYVNLEPCSHHGKTPPCADMIIHHKIPRVVVGSNDPNPKVAGKGIQKLKDAGVEVITGILKNECDFLNRRFLTYFLQHRPYIILKWAESSDGFMAPEEPGQFWLTNEYSKKLVHQWRGEEQAILVGKRTIEIDDPELTVRLAEGKNPTRVIIDRNLSIPSSRKIFFPNAPILVYNELNHTSDGRLHFEKIDFGNEVLPQVLHSLYQKNIQSIIVEGGPYTLQQFIDQNLWDEARIFTALVVMGSGRKSPSVYGLIEDGQNIAGDRLRFIFNRSHQL